METKDKILIVEDDETIAAFLIAVLEANGFDTIRASLGREAVTLISSHCPDLVLLDLSLPDMDGMEILSGLRKWSTLPVIVVSARGRERDKVIALDMGADDYLTKPFESAELLARIKALMWRKNEFVGDTLSYGDLKLNRDNCSLTCNGQEISLGKKEFQIIEMLILNGGKALNKERLIEKIWGFDSEAEYNAIEVHVSFLRKKLALLSSSVSIKSLRGIGYILEDNNAKGGQS